jgi:hypothetical protein
MAQDSDVDGTVDAIVASASTAEMVKYLFF